MITVQVSSTRTEQIALIHQLFASYGRARVNPFTRFGQRGQRIHDLVNASFDFLLPRPNRVPYWILKNDNLFVAFFSGLVDAEGSFNIRHTPQGMPYGVFSIGMTDERILKQCRTRLIRADIHCGRLNLMYRAGHTNKQGLTARKDFWTFQVAAKTSLAPLIDLLSPPLKHAKRRADMQRVEENIKWRMSDAFRHEAQRQ